MNYPTDFKNENFPDQEQYGIALTKPSWLMRGLENMAKIRILSFTERELDGHQDVVVFGSTRSKRIGIRAPSKLWDGEQKKVWLVQITNQLVFRLAVA